MSGGLACWGDYDRVNEWGCSSSSCLCLRICSSQVSKHNFSSVDLTEGPKRLVGLLLGSPRQRGKVSLSKASPLSPHPYPKAHQEKCPPLDVDLGMSCHILCSCPCLHGHSLGGGYPLSSFDQKTHRGL